MANRCMTSHSFQSLISKWGLGLAEPNTGRQGGPSQFGSGSASQGMKQTGSEWRVALEVQTEDS